MHHHCTNQKLYCDRLVFVNLDSARQSKIEAQAAERGRPFPNGKSDEEDRFGKVAASPNSQNLTERGITQRELASSKNRERMEIGIKNRRMTCPEVPKGVLALKISGLIGYLILQKEML